MTRRRSEPFQTVLAGVDGRAGGRDAVALASALCGPRGRLILAAICEPAGHEGHGRHGTPDPDIAPRMLAAEARATQARGARAPAETVVGHDGSPGRALHMLAEERHADVIVVGSAHRGMLGRVLLGDDTRAALNGAPCAVAIAPRGYAFADPSWDRIAVGDDGSPESARALSVARSLARRGGARLLVRSVVGPASLSYRQLAAPDIDVQLQALEMAEGERLAALQGVEAAVITGEPGDALVRLGAEADLLVVGSRGYGPWDRLVHGTTTTYLARHSPCPLLIVPRGPAVDATPGRRASRGDPARAPAARS